MREPQVGDVAFPRGVNHGTYVVVLRSEDDIVEIQHFSPENTEPHNQTIRLSTYLARYEWEMDAVFNPPAVDESNQTEVAQ